MILRKRLKQATSLIATFGFAVLVALPLSAAVRCEVAIQDRPALTEDLAQLTEATNSWAKQPFAFRLSSREGAAASGLSVDPKLYANTRYLVLTKPNQPVAEGARVLQGVEFGYQLGDGFRRLGTANYAVVASDGRVLEIGGGSDELLMEIKSHIYGRDLTRSNLKAIEEINRKLIDQLRADPRAQAKLKAFVEKRGWPAGVAEEAQLAYFSSDIIDLFAWAKANGFSRKQLRDAGWLLLKFSPQGKPIYQVNHTDSIKIPFFNDVRQTQIPVWRTRTLSDRDDGKKYLGWQNDRSIERTFTPAETLYNGWKLGQVRGKTLVLTEGEFKCMIATKESGFLTLGIPGITQFDPTLAKAVVAAQPKEIIVVLDRDPVGKGLMRVDGITDSQRAAYAIANEIVRAGGQNVRVGTLPDVFDGSKVGADDLILAKGVAPYLETLNQAVAPDVYAAAIGLDTELNHKIAQRQSVAKALDAYTQATQRGNPPVATDVLSRLHASLSQLKTEVKLKMGSLYNGAVSTQQPSARFASVRLDPAGITSSDTVAHSSSGKAESRAHFSHPILLMDYAASDLELTLCRPRPCASLGATQAEIQNAMRGQVTPELALALSRVDGVLKDSGFKPTTPPEWSTALLAGVLAHDFPLDEYRFDFNVKFASGAVAPLVIYRKSNDVAVAIGRLRASSASFANESGLLQAIGSALRK